MIDIARLAIASAARWIKLAGTRARYRTDTHLHHLYHIDQGGTYFVFRETVGNDGVPGSPCVLVVAFRLRFIDSFPPMHWLFQRVCLLTTPFWSGFRGFRVKLWMVDPQTKSYLGIYNWAGTDHAKTYADALVRVLRPISTTDSVWYEIVSEQKFEYYLAERDVGDRA
jgi:hypothetical protein